MRWRLIRQPPVMPYVDPPFAYGSAWPTIDSRRIVDDQFPVYVSPQLTQVCSRRGATLQGCECPHHSLRRRRPHMDVFKFEGRDLLSLASITAAASDDVFALGGIPSPPLPSARPARVAA